MKSYNGVGKFFKTFLELLDWLLCKFHLLDSFQSGLIISLVDQLMLTGLELMLTEFRVMLEWLETTPDAHQIYMFLSEIP